MPYHFYLDGTELPVPPPKLTMKISNQNKTITLINDGEVNILKSPGLTDISFEVLLPQVNYPFSKSANAAAVIEKLESLKTSKTPFQFIVTRTLPKGDSLFDTNLRVSLEDYSTTEDAGNGFDITASISLKQYRDFGLKTVAVKYQSSSAAAKVITTITRSTDNRAPKTYTVVSGDTLWAICKKYLGDGSKYSEIAGLNNIKNPNLIFSGQVIKLE